MASPERLAREDVGLLRGSARFTADMPVPPDCLHAAFVRSNEAHGVLLGFDSAAALALPGVVAVLGFADIGLEPYVYFPGMALSDETARPLLAQDRVRFVGEPIAIVLANSRPEALDGCELVVVDIDPLPVVTTVEGATAPGAPVLHRAAGTNLLIEPRSAGGEDPLADATVIAVVKAENPRLASVTIEPSAILVTPDAEGSLDVWCTSQGVAAPHSRICEVLGVGEETVRVRSPQVGGGFGGRVDAVPEFLVVAVASRLVGRPVRWVEGRVEQFFSMPYGRDQRHEMRLGFDEAGHMVGLDAETWVNAGAYPHNAPALASASRRQCTGMYRIPKFAYRIGAALTNTPPVGAYRGAGQPEVNAALERAVDIGAALLGMSPEDVRRVNLLTGRDLPYDTGTGITIDSGDALNVFEEACEAADVSWWRDEQGRRRALGSALQIGLGIGCYSQTAGSGEAADFASLEFEPDGGLVIGCGSPAQGQSHHAVFASLVSRIVGVDPDVITVVDSDTEATRVGLNTGGSRSAQVLGSQIARGAELLLEKVLTTAASLLEADPRDLVTGPQGVSVVGVPASLISWVDVAASGHEAMSVTVEERLSAPTHPYGAHISVVEVDIDTGRVRLLAHLAADDCGNVLDEVAVVGQQHGGAAAGIGQAMMEAAQWDGDGTPRTVSLGDYLIAGASDLPFIDTARPATPTDRNPLGVRGIGENGAIAAPPAVQNAVVDALAPWGVTHIDIPLTPERVWQAVSGV
jgi:carbon-monoxide dehydrogenase large subunit